MAEQIISPGVFTRENDLSFLPQGVGAIGAAIVGPTVKGPAFVPTVVKSFSEYERVFGPLNSDTFVPQTVREYLKNAGSVTVTRVLAGGGWKFTNGTNEPAFIVASNSATSATIASGTLAWPAPGGNWDDGSKSLIVTASGGTYTYICVDSPIPADDTNGSDKTYYFFSGSETGSSTKALHMTLTASLTDFTFVSSSAGLQVSASAGAAGNSYGYQFESGSAAALTKTLEGGKDAEVAGGVLLGAIFPSKNEATPDLSETVITTTGASVSASFNIILSGSTGGAAMTAGTAISASVNPNNNDYLFKYLGENPNNSKTAVTSYAGTPGYTYLNFKTLQTKMHATASLVGDAPFAYPGVGSGSAVAVGGIDATNLEYEGLGITGGKEGYSYAYTPMITSQYIAGTVKELFKFYTLSHGTSTNTDFKISISNLREPSDIDGVEQYSTFSVLVRRYDDKDKVPVILEQFNNCTLDPDSANYIARVIGDRYPTYNDTLGKVEILGNYPNISKYVRVEVNSAVEAKSTSPKLSPKGFKAVTNPIATSSLSLNCIFPSASFEGVQTLGTDGVYSAKGFLGWKTSEKEPDNNNFILPLPKTAESNCTGDFNVENYSGHASSSLWPGSLSASIDSTGATGPTAGQLQFTVPFQGGDDGIAPWTPKFTGAESTLGSTYTSKTNLYGFDMSTTTAAGYTGYKKALDILSNQDEYDINMLVLPGVLHSLHSTVTAKAIDMAEGRGDTFYVMDLTEKESSVNTAIADSDGLDSNYTAIYYPWVKVLDTAANKPVLVPPSVIVPGAIAQSDRISQGAEWFAPAGLNRGVLGSVMDVKIRLNQSERDSLYDNKINPIAFFPGVGNPVIWGQKTLQSRSTALDRINVRRLLITVKKFIASSSKYLVFEQNTIATRTRFMNIVNPYLESIQQRQGLYAFRVVMDESNNTPDVIDRNQLIGAIYLQPTKTAEFIVLDFNVLPTGATFPA